MSETPLSVVRRGSVPALGAALPRRRSGVTRVIGRVVLFLFNWRVVGEIPNLPKLVVIGAPHTSNWDFPLALACLWALDLELSWMGKHTLFKGPFRWLFRAWGGIPINRTAAHGMVEQMTAEFAQRPQLLLGLAPEGTRSKVSQWRTGFYRIATAANLPIVPVALDFSRHEVRIGALFQPTGDLEADVAELQSFFRDAKGYNPELGELA